jgi:hypothetical protein
MEYVYGHSEYFVAICYNFWQFGLFVVIWNIFPILVCLDPEKSGNPIIRVSCNWRCWYILWSTLRKLVYFWHFGIFCGRLVNFPPILVCCAEKNLATLNYEPLSRCRDDVPKQK